MFYTFWDKSDHADFNFFTDFYEISKIVVKRSLVLSETVYEDEKFLALSL